MGNPLANLGALFSQNYWTFQDHGVRYPFKHHNQMGRTHFIAYKFITGIWCHHWKSSLCTQKICPPWHWLLTAVTPGTDSMHRPSKTSLSISISQAISEHKAWVGIMDLEILSKLIISYTETFPWHPLEFLDLSLGYDPILGFLSFLISNLIEEVSLSVSLIETWLRPP